MQNYQNIYRLKFINILIQHLKIMLTKREAMRKNVFNLATNPIGKLRDYYTKI